MPRITYVEANGDERIIDAKAGDSVMETAIANSVPGIIAECGGSCICATCHVIVSDEWYHRLPPIEDMEAGTLDGAIDPQARSRLSCQLTVDKTLDGLVVNTPKRQI